ncbi:hypothetical protein [Falsiroseomonas sp.]|uniref:hypothetical protein n=1 Tax=Falsiroseomonas sp. TaxID=2870721 RepID=UPI002735A5F4|nr:hypothetical protein [Falsiroseomonas sp.]MDP3417896.1 hypothetical protein [Falsiroseomonas sp.]
MSYAQYDHAGWAEANGAAAKSMGAKPRRDRDGNAVGWGAMPERLSPFQARVMNIIGLSLGGIYNAPIAWDRVVWGTAGARFEHMHVPLSYGHLSTFDSRGLTLLVLACHAARIRMSISPYGTRGLMLSFSQRDSGITTMGGHPDVPEAVAAFDAYLGPDHRIAYREPAVAGEAA